VKRYKDLHEEASAAVAAGIEAAEEKCECSAGCTACCRGVISVSVPEAIYIFHAFAQDKFRAARLPKIWERITDQVALLHKGMSVADLLEKGVECVFLHDGGCLVYNWRPVLCRARTSFDDPAKCAITDSEIYQLDVTPIAEKLHKVTGEIGRELRLSTAAMPLPIAFSFARSAFDEGLYALRDSLKFAPR